VIVDSQFRPAKARMNTRAGVTEKKKKAIHALLQGKGGAERERRNEGERKKEPNNYP